MMLRITTVTKRLLPKCRKFLARDPMVNVLTLGDCYPPLLKASTLYCACEDDEVVGVASVFHGFSNPSIVLGTATAEVKRNLFEKALEDIKNEFISIVPTSDLSLLKEHAFVLQLHDEQQMVTESPKTVKANVKVNRVRESELEELGMFYSEQHALAWTPLQFEVGPFYCVKQNGRIVSAAGVHICTPQIAHLGSITTKEAYRNRGFGSACTSMLARKLSAGGRIVSLYVRADNAAAIHMYEKLGFVKKRKVVFATMRKNTAKLP